MEAKITKRCKGAKAVIVEKRTVITLK